MKFKGNISIIDWYIIKKFIGTYFFSIFLILSIAVVFDINEKLDSFLNPNCSLYQIVFHYYANFIPFFANLFSPLFVFISVIFFTSKLSQDNEIISMLASGMSFKRMLKPYMISSGFIALISFILSNFLIPSGTKLRLDFEDTFISSKKAKYATIVQMEVKKDELIFLRSYDAETCMGYEFALEKYKDKNLVSRMTADNVKYLGNSHWLINNYRIRTFTDSTEVDKVGTQIDSIIPIEPTDFVIGKHDMETMTTPQLINHIDRLKSRGVNNYTLFQMEVYNRIASVFSSFILAFIGVVLSSKKKKNGMGINIAIGVSLCFIYIFLMTITTTFAVGGDMPAILAAWTPNIMFTTIGLMLYRQAPK